LVGTERPEETIAEDASPLATSATNSTGPGRMLEWPDDLEAAK
jgi:hypothetical protein